MVVGVVKNLPVHVGDTRDGGSIPGLGRSPEVGNGNPLQHSCLGNPMDRGAWQATELDTTEHVCMTSFLIWKKRFTFSSTFNAITLVP